MVHTKFHDRELDEVSMKIAKQCVGETTESRSKELQILKNKLLSIDDLHPRLDDEFLLRYLRVAKFDLNKAFQRVVNYYTIKKKYHHIFDTFYPSAAPSAWNARLLMASPKRAEDNSAIFIHKRGLYIPSKIVYEEMFLLVTLILDYLVDNPVTQLCGVTVILDFEDYNFQTLMQDTPGRIRMAVDAFQNSFPLRYTSIHVVNAPRIFSLLYNVCYPFLTKKIRSKMHFHDNGDSWKTLHALVSPDVLPVAYGGTLQNSDMIDLSQDVLKKDDYFKEQLQYGFVKKKRGFFN